MKKLKIITLAAVIFAIVVPILISSQALAVVEGTWVTNVTDLHVNGDVMFQDGGDYIYSHCSSTYVTIPEGDPRQKNILALILMAKATNREIMCRIDRETSVDRSHCDVYYCKID